MSPGLPMVPYLAAFALLLDRILALEIRLLGQPKGTTDSDRARVLLAAVVTAFIAFTGVATLVPGGLAEPGGAAAGGGTLSQGWLVVLAIDDALIALLLGYRLAVLRYGTAADAARSALTYAIVVAVAAGATRAIDVPAAARPGGADARVLPVGRAPRHGAGAPSRAPVPVGAGAARRARRGGRRMEPPAARLTAHV